MLETRFPSLFQIMILDSLKSFSQLDHQVDVSFHLTEATALYYFRE